MATDKTGKFNYCNSFGVRSLKEEPLDKNEPLAIDAIMWIASCMKLLTSIAAMQCVERGLVTLDEDVRPILHELEDLDVIVGVKDGTVHCRRSSSSVDQL